MTGAISRLANSYGSTWGRIRPTNLPREIFFNQTSLDEGQDFKSLVVDQQVEFEEEYDRTNGTHAVRVRVIAPAS